MQHKLLNNFFKEQHPYSVSDLISKLEIEEGKAREFIKRFILAGLVKNYQEDKPDDWVDDALHSEYISGDDVIPNCFKFVYVGLVEIEGKVLICYPKYIRESHETNKKYIQEDMRLILTALEKYNSEHTEMKISLDDHAMRIPNQLAMALYLIRDFFTYGLYVNERNELKLHGHGEIDWETTITTTMPLIKDNSPYYFDYYTNDMRQDETDYISRLHTCIISECSKKLNECGLADILQLETPSLYSGERIDFGSNEFICKRLQNELNIQFDSHKQLLLRNMLSWVENEKFSTDPSELQLFGTNSFHSIWEKMCAEVFKSQYKKTPLQALGITLKGDYIKKGQTTLASLIEKPEWLATEASSPVPAKKTLVPDFVRVEPTKHGHFFVILDAKYYDIELTDKTVQGQPGVEDICKQYLYQLAYSSFIHTHGLYSINAFISPTDEAKSSQAGTAAMPLFSFVTTATGYHLGSIHVIKLSAREILNTYNRGKTISLSDAFDDLFAKVAKEKSNHSLHKVQNN